MRLPSTITMISVGLACLTLSVLLAAQSIGVISNDEPALMRARLQAIQLLVAQCQPAAQVGDTRTLFDLVDQMAATNDDIMIAEVFDASGASVFSRSHAGGGVAPEVDRVRMPILDPVTGNELAVVQFGYERPFATASRYLPAFLDGLIRNPALRLGGFVALVGFACYRVYLRRMLRALDPTSVIPPRVRTMLDCLAEGILVLDRRGTIVMANASFSRTARLSLDKLQGSRVDKLKWTTPFTDVRPKTLPWAGMLTSGQAVTGVQIGLTSFAAGKDAGDPAADEQRRIYVVNAAPILSHDGKVRGGLATFDDVTELERINQALSQSRDEIQRQNAELFRLATTDPMTGCLNRRSFMDQFERHWQQAAAGRQMLGCVMVDVDRFKSINDRFGHAAGDSVLIDVARILRGVIGDVDANALVCRYGGEEFCCLLPGATLEATAAVAERLRTAIETEQWTITPVTASLGVSATEQGASDIKQLLGWADQALYHSKKSGRNRVTGWGEFIEEPHAEPALVPGRSAA